MTSAHSLEAFWRLDPECIYLNHGSFGPSPIPVQEARARWSERLERQPMKFFCQDMEEELERTAQTLGRFMGTQADRLALLDNSTFAMNVVAASVTLKPDDEILLTDHEYGAVKNIWQSKCRESGARMTTAILPFLLDEEGIVRAIESALTPKTKLIVISHVTSATAWILPVKAVTQMARRHNIPVCVDGPHAVAMLDVNLNDLGCDYYCASGHKWLCAPFGSGFLWVHPKHQSAIRCPIVSWGGSIAGRAATRKDRTNWLGTRDPAPLLSITDAINFFVPERLAAYRSHAHEMVTKARSALLEIPGTSPFFTPRESDYVSMVAVELPQTKGWTPGYHGHPDVLQTVLRDQHQIELLMGSWNGRRFMRVSAHLYTTEDQINKLIDAVRRHL